MSARRKFPITRLIPQWQRVQNACPEHPDCEMQKMRVAGRELWTCPHPSHDTGEVQAVQKQETGGLLINPIRARAAHAAAMREAQLPMLQLPAARSTGPIRPVSTGALRPSPAIVAFPAEPPMQRPAWVDEIVANGVQEAWLTAEPAQPANWMQGKQPTDAMRQLEALADGVDDETVEVPVIMQRRHVRKSEGRIGA